MPCNIAFYVHHHGAGHLMRTLAIAKAMKNCNITLMGSDLKRYSDLIPESYQQLHLPLDIPDKNDLDYTTTSPLGLHYAPYNVKGLRDRTDLITSFITKTYPLLLIVDVSVEISMLATIAGIPFIVVRQHGNRTDQAHLQAYHNALGLLAPYSQLMAGNNENWMRDKTFYAGGIAKINPASILENEDNRQISILIGNGGTSITSSIIINIASTCPDWHFHILGMVDQTLPKYANLTSYGNIPNPESIIKNCSIVIGNTGHNTVMEVAAMGKRFIAIPEERPFDEQVVKAEILHNLGLATIIPPTELKNIAWNDILNDTLMLTPDWTGIVEKQAAEKAAQYLKNTYKKIFKNSGSF